jgi:hypothetical protein
LLFDRRDKGCAAADKDKGTKFTAEDAERGLIDFLVGDYNCRSFWRSMCFLDL